MTNAIENAESESARQCSAHDVHDVKMQSSCGVAHIASPHQRIAIQLTFTAGADAAGAEGAACPLAPTLSK